MNTTIIILLYDRLKSKYWVLKHNERSILCTQLSIELVNSLMVLNRDPIHISFSKSGTDKSQIQGVLEMSKNILYSKTIYKLITIDLLLFIT